jgi:choice-of-anchor A domain-containing protein
MSSRSFLGLSSTSHSIPRLSRLSYLGPSIVILGVLGSANSAQALTFNHPSAYNIFVHNSLTLSNSEILGRTAAGGNATLSGVDIGKSYPKATGNAAQGAPEALVVGNDLDFSNGNIGGSTAVGGDVNNLQGYQAHGDVNSGGSLTTTNGITHGTSTSNNAATTAATTAFFSSAHAALTQQSSNFSALSGSTAQQNGNTLAFQGNNASSNQVFNLTGADLTGISYLDFSGIDAAAQVIINIAGTNAALQNLGWGWNGQSMTASSCQGNSICDRLFYNFYEATTLDLGNISLGGTILANQANVSFNNAAFAGHLVANDLTATNLSFVPTDSQNNPQAVPTPALLPGLLGFGMTMLNKRRQSV